MLSWVSSYYNNREQLKHYWLPAAYALRDYVEAIIVDDHSQEHKAIDVFEETGLDFPLRIFYVDEDLGFNSHGARNLGVSKASHDYVLLTDMDKTLGTVGLLAATQRLCPPGEYYRLLNWNEKDGHKPSNNNFLLNKNDFLKVGGYDEGYTGYYYGDAAFRRRLETVAEMKTYPNLVCFCTERENPEWDKKRGRRVVHTPNTPFINFEYTEVL